MTNELPKLPEYWRGDTRQSNTQTASSRVPGASGVNTPEAPAAYQNTPSASGSSQTEYVAVPGSVRPARKRRAGIIIGAIAAVVILGALFVNALGGFELKNPNEIAVIEMSGTIAYGSGATSPEGLDKLMDQAEADPRIKAIVLRVNSGGGSSAAGEEMAMRIRDAKKPVVVSTTELNASAAYHISSQADYIYVAKSSEVGAIGTIMQISDLSGLLEKLGISIDSIASSPSKDSSYGMRPLTDEERAQYQQMIDDINQVFKDNVQSGRNLSDEEINELSTGMVWAGERAVDLKLADEIGMYQDACDKAAELGGIAGDYDTEIISEAASGDMSKLIDLLMSSKFAGNDQAVLHITELIKELVTYDQNPS